MNTEPRVRVVPGDGVVTRLGPVVAVLIGGAADMVASLLELLERLGAQGGQLDARVFTRELVAHFARSGTDVVPDVGAVALLEDELAVVLHGAVDCLASRLDGEVTLRGRDAAVSVNVVLEGPVTRVSLFAEGTEPGEGEPWSHLVAGVVPGAAAVVVDEQALQAASDQATDVSADQLSPAAKEDDTTELVEPEPVEVPPPAQQPAHAAQRPPLPTALEETAADDASTGPDASTELVDGIECQEGHFNHPYALECSVCGRSLLDSARRTVQGPRQRLGTLTLDDGTSHALVANYVIGREPEEDAAVKSHKARALRLEDPDNLVSRVHADIRLVGWEVQVIDRDSANGTYVLAPEGNEWQRVPGDKPQTISPGTRVSIGRKVLTYEW